MTKKEETLECLREVLRGDCPFPVGIARYTDCLPLLPCRAAKRIPEGASTVLLCLFPYLIREIGVRNLSRYAVIADYHQIAGEYLNRACAALKGRFPAHQFEPFVDNSPIREVSAANRAGLGVVGENGLLIHPRYGSFVFIGEIVTDLELEPDQPSPAACIRCGRCRRTCPGGAIRPNGSIELSACRSHITQKKGDLTEREREEIRKGGLIWGCDLCNEACPMNREAEETPVPEFRQSAIPVVTEENLERILQNRAFNYRGKKVLLRNLEILSD